MSFSNTTTGAGALNPAALVEQFAMVMSAYQNSRASADEVLVTLGGGSVLSFQFNETSWPPSWCMTVSGNTISIAFTGTVNFRQLVADIAGCYGTPYASFPCVAHGFFYLAWLAIRATIIAAIPPNMPNAIFIFTGHSYGAAVAFFAALEFEQNNRGSQRQFLGFALPRSLTAGYNGPLPAANNFLTSAFDAISNLPPVAAITNPLPQSGLVLSGIPTPYTHYAAGWTSGTGITPAAEPASYFTAIPTLDQLSNTFNFHPSAAYAVMIGRIWSTSGQSGVQSAIVDIMLELAAQRNAQNQSPFLDLASFVNFAYQNTSVFGGTPTFPLTASNVTTVNTVSSSFTVAAKGNAILPAATRGNGAFPMPDSKITFYYRDNISGFSESHIIPGAVPNAVLQTTIQDYLKRRLAISGPQTFFMYCRVAQVGSPRVVQIWYPGALTGLPQPPIGNSAGQVTGPAALIPFGSDLGQTSVIVRKETIGEANGFALWYIRGVPDAVITQGGLYSPDQVPGFPAAMRNFLNYITNQGWAFRGTNAQQPAASLITNITINADGTATFTVQTAGFFPNALITKRYPIRVRRVNSPKQMNGPYTVTVNSATTCTTLNQFAYPNYIINQGQVTFQTLQTVVIASFQIEKIGERKTGRPFGLSAGRAKTKLAR